MDSAHNKRTYVKNLKFYSTLIAVATLGTLSTSCAPKQEKQIAASFKMTGSSSPATVAANEKPSFLRMLMQEAQAFMPSTLRDSSGLTITLTNAWTVLKEVEFKTEEINGVEDSEIEVEFTGPYVIDLLANAPLILDTQLIAEKPIRRIKMKFHKAETLPSGSPAGLLNNSIYLTGTVGANSFTLQMDDSTEVQIAGPNGFEPRQGSEMLVEIQLANIFKQINMSTITNGQIINNASRHPGVNLCPSIDASANDIYTCMRKGLEKHANFGMDNDGDDDLDSVDSKVK